MHHHLDVYAYTNHLKHVPPQQKLIFALIALSIALMTRPLTQGLIWLWLSLWTVGYARIPAKVYGQMVAVVTLFLITSLPALLVEVVSIDSLALGQLTIEQLATTQAHALGGVTLGHWYVFISYPGLMRAVEIGMRSLACVACLLFILFTIPFAELLAVLRQCRVPTVLLDLLLLMYRFVFLFLDVVTQLQLAQQARGGYRTRQRWMHSVALLIGQLVVRSLQRYQQFSLGLAARGFNGEFQVCSTQSYRYSSRYAWESVLGCVCLVLFDVSLL